MREFIKDDLLCDTNKIGELMLMEVEEKSSTTVTRKLMFDSVQKVH